MHNLKSEDPAGYVTFSAFIIISAVFHVDASIDGCVMSALLRDIASSSMIISKTWLIHDNRGRARHVAANTYCNAVRIYSSDYIIQRMLYVPTQALHLLSYLRCLTLNPPTACLRQNDSIKVASLECMCVCNQAMYDCEVLTSVLVKWVRDRVRGIGAVLWLGMGYVCIMSGKVILIASTPSVSSGAWWQGLCWRRRGPYIDSNPVAGFPARVSSATITTRDHHRPRNKLGIKWWSEMIESQENRMLDIGHVYTTGHACGLQNSRYCLSDIWNKTQWWDRTLMHCIRYCANACDARNII